MTAMSTAGSISVNDDLIESLPYVGPARAQETAVEPDVLPAGQLGVDAGSFDEGPDPTPDPKLGG